MTSTSILSDLETDSRPLFAVAMATGTQVVAGVRPEQLHDPTPCTEMDVEQLLGHLVAVLDRVAAMGRSENPMAAGAAPAVAGGDWLSAWLAAVDDVRASWDDESLRRPVTLPWTSGTGAEVLRTYYVELTVHTWDLARATGQQPAWNRRVVDIANALTTQLLPGEGRAELFAAVREHMAPELRDGPDPFGPVVPVPADAPAIDRLVAWNGRTP